MGSHSFYWQSLLLNTTVLNDTGSWSKLSIRAVNIASPKLEFSKLTEGEDEGIYHCIVPSIDGDVVSNNATITIYVKL